MTLCRQIVTSLSIWSNKEGGLQMYSLQSLHFINSNLLFYKKWKQNDTDFLQKCTDISKIKLKLHMCVITYEIASL